MRSVKASVCLLSFAGQTALGFIPHRATRKLARIESSKRASSSSLRMVKDNAYLFVESEFATCSALCAQKSKSWKNCNKNQRTTMMAEATTEPQALTSWEDIRTELVGKECIKQLKVAGTNESAYYVALSDVQFRHGGDFSTTAAPAQVSLIRPPVNLHGEEISGAKLDSIVGVYYSSSGTGKTVDLAGASYIRNTQLSFFISISDGVDLSQKFRSASERNSSAMKSLKSQLLILLTERRGIQDVLVGILSGGVTRLTICLDEASSCPIIVRSIISNTSFAMQTVQETIWEAVKELEKKSLKKKSEQNMTALEDASRRLKILFSVGGTGASGGSVGSVQDNYEYLKTSASLQPKKMYDALLAEMVKGRELRRTYSYDAITANTLLKVLVDGNARMTSILVKIIGNMDDDDLDNRGLLEETLEKFRRCNGLNILDDQASKCKAAAQAIAVHLFQKQYTVPENLEEQADALIEMDYHGVTFARSIRPYPSNLLVARFGLLEPEPFSASGTKINAPFRLPPAMQLMTMFLMGLSGVSPLEFSSFGFEVLSTQMIKSAIAAALTVTFNKRPHLDEVLRNQLQFQLSDEKWTDGAKAWWDKFSTLKPVQIKFSKDDFRKTRMQRARATIKQKLVKTQDEEGYKVARYVFFDEELGDELISLSEDENSDTDCGFCPPLCSISTGNSDLADGYVTFFVTNIANIAGSNNSDIEDWTTEEVAEWLEHIGMDQYKDAFGKRSVNGFSLESFNERKLMRLGVEDEEHREAILEALERVKEEKEPRGEKMTICNQAKDYHNSKLSDSGLNGQAMKVGYACLEKMFGDRLYCVASSKKAWQRDISTSRLQRAYLAFDVSESRLLGNDVFDIADLRNQNLQDLKHGKHYDSDLNDFPDTKLEDYLSGLSMAEINKLEEQSKEDQNLNMMVKTEIQNKKQEIQHKKQAKKRKQAS